MSEELKRPFERERWLAALELADAIRWRRDIERAYLKLGILIEMTKP